MIEVKNVSKSYGEVHAVKDISFVAKDGRVTGFLGPNGAGKSTTLKMIAGLERPDEGKCFVGGQSPTRMRTPSAEIGVLLDGQGAIPGMNARDYLRSVAAPNRISDSRVDNVIELVGLKAGMRRRVGTYSLGMKQRLGIAVALLGDPTHLVLDEPINGLDPDGVIWMRELLRHLAGEGSCVLLSSHLMSELEQCVDDLVIIDSGRMLKSGSLDAVTQTNVGSTIVRSDDSSALAAALTAEGAEISWEEDRLRVVGLDPSQIGAVAFHAGVILNLLFPEKVGLEQAYLSIIENAGVEN